PAGKLEPFAAITPAKVPLGEGQNPPVYVSYAWEDESEELLERLEARLPADIQWIRDKSHMRPGHWISRFMQEIGRAECVVVVISEKYLRSAYCMRELLYLYRRGMGDRDDFHKRVVAVIVGDVPLSR